MPNLYNSDLAQNARRVRMGDTNLGTRRLQFYTIVVYGLSDAYVDLLDAAPGRFPTIEGTFMGPGIDQLAEVEFTTASLIEAVLRGVQRVSETYMVGFWDFADDGDDYNNLILTVAVSADTFESGWEQDIRGTTNDNSDTMYSSVGDSVDEYLDGIGQGWDGLDVKPMMLVGEILVQMGAPYARNSAEVKALRASRKSESGPQYKRP